MYLLVYLQDKNVVLSAVHLFLRFCVCVCMCTLRGAKKKSSKQQDRELVSDFVDFSVAVPSNRKG